MEPASKAARLVPRTLTVSKYSPLSSAPSLPSEGNLYYDDGSNTQTGFPGFRYYDGARWNDLVMSAITDFPTADIQDSSGNSFVMTGDSTCKYWAVNEWIHVLADLRWSGKGSAVAGDVARVNIVPIGPLGGISEYFLGTAMTLSGGFIGGGPVFVYQVSGAGTLLAIGNRTGSASFATKALLVSEVPASGSLQIQLAYTPTNS